MSVRTFRFRLTSQGEAPAVSLTVEGDGLEQETATGPFLFDLTPHSRIGEVIDGFSRGIGGLEDVLEVGTLLYEGLLREQVKALFNRHRDAIEADGDDALAVVRICADPDLQHLPWECLYDERRRGFLLNHSKYVLVRDADGGARPVRVPAGQVPLRMLVAVPGGSRLEVTPELHRLRLTADKLHSSVQLEVLQGHVTPDILDAKLQERHWDIVHFIGHGDIVGDMSFVRLNDELPDSDHWIPAEAFELLFSRRAPRLVVLNCCLGGRDSAKRTLSGVGGRVFRAGVPSVIAMQYEIANDVATRFAGCFYNELLGGEHPGRIDLALAATRRNLSINQRESAIGFITPVLYLAEGRGRLFTAAAPEPQPTVVVSSTGPGGEPPPPPPPPSPPLPPLPASLVRALQERRCVVVVGPEVLTIGAMRGAETTPMRPRDLAGQLAKEIDCTALFRDQLAIEDTSFEDELLSRVCQIFQTRNPRADLLLALQHLYRNAHLPPQAQAMASWDVPGLICLHFDGLLQSAINSARGADVRLITSPQESLKGFKERLLVFYLRGYLDDPESLMLTESDQEVLYDRLGRISPAITDALVRKQIGMAALCIGVSPRNRLLRRMTHVLRAPEIRPRSCGPVYFACDYRTDLDDAFWRNYDVQWLPLSTEQVVAAVSAVSRRP